MPYEVCDPCLPISIIVTTYNNETRNTQMCLESIRRWLAPHHELIVVSHDESALLRAYLDACRDEGLISELVYAVPGHGHTQGFDLGLQYSSADVVFHIRNDVLIGPSIVDYCAWQLRHDRQLGLVGWHRYGEGTRWRDGRAVDFVLSDAQGACLDQHRERSIRDAQWFTGRLFDSLGGPIGLRACSTAFFGARREVLELVGSGLTSELQHDWPDDFLSYAILDQGLDVRNFHKQFRSNTYFRELQYDQMGVPKRPRHKDSVVASGVYLESVELYRGGMTKDESVYLHLLAQSIPDGAVVTGLGTWKGASTIVLLDALKNKEISFYFVDCFDLPNVSAQSGQPPVAHDVFLRNISPYIRPQHTLSVNKVDSRDLTSVPRSDFIFIDGGHTEECIRHDAQVVKKCLTNRGVAVFHDYGQPRWPAIKIELDHFFSPLDVYKTVAVYRRQSPARDEFRPRRS